MAEHHQTRSAPRAPACLLGAMRKLVLLSAVALLPCAAHAALFTFGSPVFINGIDGADGSVFSFGGGLPGGASSDISFAIDDNAETIRMIAVPTTGGGEWLVFYYQSQNSGNLALGNGDWKLEESGFTSNVAANFDAAFGQFYASGGVLLAGTNAVFPGYSAEADPIPGFAGLGLAASGIGTTGFTDNFAAGSPLDFYATLSPFSQLAGDGIDPNAVTGWVQALHFDPQIVVTDVPEPGTLAILSVGLAGLITVRWRRPPEGHDRRVRLATG